METIRTAHCLESLSYYGKVSVKSQSPSSRWMGHHRYIYSNFEEENIRGDNDSGRRSISNLNGLDVMLPKRCGRCDRLIKRGWSGGGRRWPIAGQYIYIYIRGGKREEGNYFGHQSWFNFQWPRNNFVFFCALKKWKSGLSGVDTFWPQPRVTNGGTLHPLFRRSAIRVVQTYIPPSLSLSLLCPAQINGEGEGSNVRRYCAATRIATDILPWIMGLSTEPVPDIQRKSPHIPPFFRMFSFLPTARHLRT